jgi:hypothetical protein
MVPAAPLPPHENPISGAEAKSGRIVRDELPGSLSAAPTAVVFRSGVFIRRADHPDSASHSPLRLCEYAAPLAYIGGSMGTLIGTDLSNLDKINGLGAPVASIGGAGTFDGIFLTGILAVLLAGIVSPSRPRPAW